MRGDAFRGVFPAHRGKKKELYMERGEVVALVLFFYTKILHFVGDVKRLRHNLLVGLRVACHGVDLQRLASRLFCCGHKKSLYPFCANALVNHRGDISDVYPSVVRLVLQGGEAQAVLSCEAAQLAVEVSVLRSRAHGYVGGAADDVVAVLAPLDEAVECHGAVSAHHVQGPLCESLDGA